MKASIKLAALAAAIAVIATPVVGVAAQSQKASQHRYAAYRHRPSIKSWRCNDCYPGGWRYRLTARGWDNTCVNVPWLPSAFACSAK